MEFLNPEIVEVGKKFTDLVLKNNVSTIMDRIRAAKQTHEKDEIIIRLQEIINELIAEKNELIQMIQLYQETLIMQKISDKEIEYITTSVIPIIEKLIAENSENLDGDSEKVLSAIKPLLSKETFSILQMLGFNFKNAIGEPLTNLVRALIHSKIPFNSIQQYEYAKLEQMVTLEALKLSQNEEAFERLMLVRNRQLEDNENTD